MTETEMTKKTEKEMTGRAGGTAREIPLSAEEASCAVNALRCYRDRLLDLSYDDGGPLRRALDAARDLHEGIAASRRGDGGSTARAGLAGLTLLAEAVSLHAETLGGMKLSAGSPLGEAEAAASRLLTRLAAEIRAGKGGAL